MSPSPVADDVEEVVVAFDVMGGDHGPEAIVRGAVSLTRSQRNVRALLVGDGGLIQETLNRLRHSAEKVSVLHAPEYIASGEHASTALANKPKASIAVAARALADGEADALVAAGNTGACILASSHSLKLIPGVRRAALATVYPTQAVRGLRDDPFSLILDVGATSEATASDLVHFALMGSAYARIVSRNARPSVALLANSLDAHSGPQRVGEACNTLRALSGIRFIGTIEGTDIPKGTADVVVCDGFVGNVCVKMLEGVHDTVLSLATYAYKERLLWRVGLAMLSSGIDRIKQITDWEQYGGAPILGFDHVVIKANSRSGARAIANAGKVAVKAVKSRLPEAIAQLLPLVP